MKKALLLLLSAIFIIAELSAAGGKPRRKISVQTSSLRIYTVEEALEKLKGMDIDGVEIYPGQMISRGRGPVPFGIDLEPQHRELLKKMLKNAGLKISSMGVIGTGADEALIERYCAFAKNMGFDAIMTEDSVYSFPMWERQGEKYGVTMGLHNHALDSANQYFDADMVLKYTRPFKHVAANPDTGHLARSDISPLESVKKLEGKMVSIHLKDMNAFGDMSAQCVPFGEGALNLKELLAELDRQNYGGWLVIEYEADWENNMESIRKCVEFLRNN